MPKTNKRAKGRDREGFASTLPVWIVEPGKVKGTLHIKCPVCGGKVVVSKKGWIDGPSDGPFIGRSCTYCFRTARIPKSDMNQRTKDAYSRG